jgi:hypothetical protein
VIVNALLGEEYFDIGMTSPVISWGSGKPAIQSLDLAHSDERYVKN